MSPTLQYIINSALGIILAATIAALKKIFVDFSYLRKGLTAMLHNQLYRTCDEYLRRGKVTRQDLEDLEELFQCYRYFGLNGIGEEMYKRCRKLEIITIDTEKDS